MGKSLIITEKPSVAQEFAKVLGVSGGRRDGYLENQKYVITWCVTKRYLGLRQEEILQTYESLSF